MAKIKRKKSKKKRTAEAELAKLYDMMARREPPPGSIIPLDMPIMRLARG